MTYSVHYNLVRKIVYKINYQKVQANNQISYRLSDKDL